MALETKEENIKSDLERDLHLRTTATGEGAPGWVLTATCEDIDGMSSADFMGKVDIELQSLLKEPKRRSRSWHKLGAVDGKSSNVTGELDIVVQWRYNAALDFRPLVRIRCGTPSTHSTRRLDEEKDPTHADKDPNELRIALVQGRSLAVKDKAVLYGAGSSDPRVRFKVTGTKYLSCSSKCIKKVWTRRGAKPFHYPSLKGLFRGREAHRLRRQRPHPRGDVRRRRCRLGGGLHGRTERSRLCAASLRFCVCDGRSCAHAVDALHAIDATR